MFAHLVLLLGLVYKPLTQLFWSQPKPPLMAHSAVALHLWRGADVVVARCSGADGGAEVVVARCRGALVLLCTWRSVVASLVEMTESADTGSSFPTSSTWWCTLHHAPWWASPRAGGQARDLSGAMDGYGPWR